ncbi:MAG: hypothetical protein OXR64_07065 [Chloroflexota bacterium]|nr:hypothetical protein [Chloroflexota bacterium]MDE2919594.1 hypothetical protein [Chloroflexota bacterium]
MLFRPVTGTSSKHEPRETAFEFVQRSDHPQLVQRRACLEKWYAHVPSEAKPGIERRLRSKDENNFRGALFEIHVFTILRRLNCAVKIEPQLPNTLNRPDFFAVENGDEFFVEATNCGYAQGEFAPTPSERDAIRKLRNHINSPHSSIALFARGALRENLKTSIVVQRFQDLLDRYPEDKVAELYARGGLDNAPSTSICVGDWTLEGRLMPTHPSRQTGYITGPTRAGAAGGLESLYSSIKKKAEKWRNVDLNGRPFLVAINVLHSAFDWHDSEIQGSIYGNPVTSQIFDSGLSCLSGVIVFDGLGLGTEKEARVKLYRNGKSHLPACLESLLSGQRSSELLGFESQ